MYNLEQAIATLAVEFTNRFSVETPTQRTVGREAEFPVVTMSGEAADVRYLWDLLLADHTLQPHTDSGNRNLIVGLDGNEYSYALEVGVGTIEINTRPCQSLFEVQAIMERAVNRLVRAAAARSFRVLGYGIQPVSPPTLRIMAPKQRYQSLYRAMGAEWLWYTVTASDQAHLAIGRAELVQMLNVGNLITPVIIALCANSPIYGGRRSPFCSSREGRMAEIHANEFRHGMPARPYTSIADYVECVSQATYLIMRDQGMVIPSSRPFTDYLREYGPDLPAFLFHEHYIWNSARLRAAYGTVEIRPACQQPWNEHIAAAALTVGLMESANAIEEYIQHQLGATYWNVMRTYHRQVIRLGLAAPQPAPNFLATLVDFAEAGLRRRNLGEETLLTPLRYRLQRRQNPAQRARQVFDLDGLSGLLDYATVRPRR